METRSTDQDGSAASFTTGRLKVEWTSGSADNLVIDSKVTSVVYSHFFCVKNRKFLSCRISNLPRKHYSPRWALKQKREGKKLKLFRTTITRRKNYCHARASDGTISFRPPYNILCPSNTRTHTFLNRHRSCVVLLFLLLLIVHKMMHKPLCTCEKSRSQTDTFFPTLLSSFI